jgi:hypothetical protein
LARTALFPAAAFFAVGAAAVWLHHHLTVADLLLCHNAVTYVQLPGFINAVSNRAAMRLLFTFLLLGLAFGGLLSISAVRPPPRRPIRQRTLEKADVITS